MHKANRVSWYRTQTLVGLVTEISIQIASCMAYDLICLVRWPLQSDCFLFLIFVVQAIYEAIFRFELSFIWYNEQESFLHCRCATKQVQKMWAECTQHVEY